MNTMFRLFMVVGMCFLALLLLLVGLAQHNENLLGPVNFLMLIVAVAIYLLPTALAVYRGCESVGSITLIDIFLGWTIIGWLYALGWASGGKTRPLPPARHPPSHPLPSH